MSNNLAQNTRSTNTVLMLCLGLLDNSQRAVVVNKNIEGSIHDELENCAALGVREGKFL